MADTRSRFAAGTAFAVVACVVAWAVHELHRWAATAFVRPELASALLTVVELAVLGVVLAWTPALAFVIRRFLGGGKQE